MATRIIAIHARDRNYDQMQSRAKSRLILTRFYVWQTKTSVANGDEAAERRGSCFDNERRRATAAATTTTVTWARARASSKKAIRQRRQGAAHARCRRSAQRPTRRRRRERRTVKREKMATADRPRAQKIEQSDRRRASGQRGQRLRRPSALILLSRRLPSPSWPHAARERRRQRATRAAARKPPPSLPPPSSLDLGVNAKRSGRARARLLD